MPKARLPGVCPFQRVSNQAGSSHSTTKAAMRTMPVPVLPSGETAIRTTTTTAMRSRKSTAQASARGTGPAGPRVSSMPSGVATRRVVSSISPLPGTDFRCLSAPHRVEELGVGLGGPQLVDEEFCRFQLVHREEQLPQHPDLLQHRGVDEQLLAAR